MTPSIEDATVQAALDTLAPSVEPDVERALRQQLALQARPVSLSLWRRAAAESSRYRVPAIAAAVLLAIGLSFATAPVRSFAAQFLPLFRVRDVTPITLDNLSDPLPNLSKFGDMAPDRPSASALKPAKAASLSAAAGTVGFNVLTPGHLPSGLGSVPVVVTTQGQTVSFTFRAQKAATYLKSIGRSDFSLPVKFDGAMLQLHVEPAVGLAYLPTGTDLAAVEQAAADARNAQLPSGAQSSSQPKPAQSSDATSINNLLNGPGVFVIETKSPSLDAQGVTADELRSFLLSMPGLSDAEKKQLAAIGDWTHTLPIPADAAANMHKVQVNGAPGVAGRNNGSNMVVWVNNGMLYAATAPKLDEKSLIDVAASLK